LVFCHKNLQYQDSLLMLLNPTEWYQLHKGCNNHIIQWTLSYNLIKLQLWGNPSVYIYLYVWYIYMLGMHTFVYNINMCIYTVRFIYICIFNLHVYQVPNQQLYKKTPVCTFISQIWPPVITASLPIDQALNMNLNL